LVVKMARENEWATRGIKGALQNLGYKIGRSTMVIVCLSFVEVCCFESGGLS